DGGAQQCHLRRKKERNWRGKARSGTEECKRKSAPSSSHLRPNLKTHQMKQSPKAQKFSSPTNADLPNLFPPVKWSDAEGVVILVFKAEISASINNLGKKRSYAEQHLEFGQSDFLWRTCSTCGLKYSPGEDGDEKVHKSFHKNYTHGIQFKGWCNERVVYTDSTTGDRVILVLDDDSSVHRKKVQEVVKMMETDLEEGSIVNKFCKVYFSISSRRIAGCLVAESIKNVYRILSCSGDRKSESTAKEARSSASTLQFGGFRFQREVTKRCLSIGSADVLNGHLSGAIFCENDAVPACCGIRAIWVSQDQVLELSQLAFSQPTSLGKALASYYIGVTKAKLCRLKIPRSKALGT
ncbi:N-acetyltransferase ESCO, zinc-finger, partial [Dillenia turbinata]